MKRNSGIDEDECIVPCAKIRCKGNVFPENEKVRVFFFVYFSSFIEF